MRVEKSNLKRILSGILCAALIVLNIPAMPDVQAADAKMTDGFYLSAVTQSETVIAPVKVEASEGQTVKEALAASGHTFAGLEDGFVTAIDGKTGIYRIFMDDNGYNLNRQASEVDVVAFAEGELYSEAMVQLIVRLGEYQAMTNHVQNYQPAKEVYQAALKGLNSKDEQKIQTLLDNLNAAITAYEESLKGDTYEVTVNAVQGGASLTSLVLTFVDAYGNKTEATGTMVSLKKGDYSFVVSDGGFNRTEGTVTVDAARELNVTLPSGEWFGDIKLLRAETGADKQKIAYAYEQNQAEHKAEYFVDDTAKELTSLYLNAVQGPNCPSAAKLYAIYTGVNGADMSTVGKSWNSTTSVLNQAVEPGMEGRTFPLEAQYTDADGYKQIQSYDLTLTRVPTLAGLVLKDGNGSSLLSGFQSYVTDYDVEMINDTLSAEAKTFGKDGYTVEVVSDHKNADGSVTIGDGMNEVAVKVSHTNGQTKVYHLHVNKIAPAAVTLDVPEGVKVQVKNANGSVMKPKEGATYELIPEQSYTYVATIDKEYHAKAFFQAKDGANITVAEPKVETALKEFRLYDTSSASNRKEVKPDKSFQPEEHAYSYVLSDANTAMYVQATKENSYAVKAQYVAQPAMTDKEVNVTATVSDTGSATALTQLVQAGAYGNTITLYLSKVDPADKNVTYYQEYKLDVTRSLHLTSLAAKTEEGEVTLADEDGSAQPFDRDIQEYYLPVSSDTERVQVEAHFMNEKDASELDGGYYAVVDGERMDSLADLEFKLDTTKKEEIKTIQVCHKLDEATSNTYTLHIVKAEPVKVTFETTPDTANVFVINELEGKPVYTEDGTFDMLTGISYTYTVTEAGYVSEHVTGFKVGGAKTQTVKVTLKKAEKNDSLVDLDAGWPSFRDENNNGVVTEATPIRDEDAVLYWANKLGSSFGSSAIGCPILVDGYLYVYSGAKLLKVDTVTGEVKKEAAMSTSSNFAINNPTYGGGMIFVGLQNGTIQAFNADTLESLWIYKDGLKGQPNTQITYRDGYIYTGFWNTEEKDANYVCISATDEDPSRPDEEKHASWTYGKKGGFYWAGAYVSKKFMLVGTDDGESGYDTGYGHIVSIDPKSGKVLDDMELPHVGDVRSNVTYDEKTDAYYFTTKGGYFYGISVNSDGTFQENSLKYVKLENGTSVAAMSTSTPTIYNGRAYVGVAGSSQFGQYSGHNVSVIDLETMRVAYQVPTQGYPQTSGILTNAYEEETGKVYVYFFDNYTPGKLRVFSDKPGQTSLAEEDITQETSGGNTYDAGYVLFTPSGTQAQYAICSPIVDEYGTIFFKNDSGNLMALGATIEKIEVTKLPDKLEYKAGETFDKKGMVVTATYTNGKTRDITEYVTCSAEKLTKDDTDFPITFEHVMYQNKDGQAGVEYTAPMTFVQLKIDGKVSPSGDVVAKIEAIGKVTLDSEAAISAAREAYDNLSEEDQAKVGNYDKLTDAETRLAELKKADAEAAEAAKAVDEKIEAIGEVTLDSEAAIKEAKKAAKEVTDKIASIGNVTLESEKAIQEARKAYDALSKEAKAFVENYEVLTTAENRLAELKKADKEDPEEKDPVKNNPENNNPEKTESAKTGDSSPILPMTVMILAAFAAILTVVYKKRRA